MTDIRQVYPGRGNILGMPIDGISMQEAVVRILDWSREPLGRMVCAADVHMVMRHFDDADFRKVITEAELVTPDGMPLVWLLQHQGYPGQERVCGPDLMLALCRVAELHGIRVGFYGAGGGVLQALLVRVKRQFPSLKVVYAHSPLFRPLEKSKDQAQIDAINEAKVQMLFVGLGCPKQEFWMAAHKPWVSAVMLGVGAAFDFHAGTIKRAPLWLQHTGLEWLFRIGTDPTRLAKRAIQHYPRFVWQICRIWFKG